MQYQGTVHFRIRVCPVQSLEPSQEDSDLVRCAAVSFLDGQKLDRIKKGPLIAYQRHKSAVKDPFPCLTFTLLLSCSQMQFDNAAYLSAHCLPHPPVFASERSHL